LLAHRLLPFAAVITPATLNISPMLVTNTTFIAAPRIGFGWEFANEIPEDKHDDTGGSLNYGGPLAPVTRAISQSLMASAVLPLTAPFPNSSYHIDFEGPALKCTEVERGSSLWMNQSMTIKNASYFPTQRCYKYLAWPGNASTSPWVHNDYGLVFDPPTGLTGDPLFTVVVVEDEACETCEACGVPEPSNITFVQCDMWNATYSADFSYNEGVQDVVSKITAYESPFFGNPTAFTSLIYPELNDPANYRLIWSYMAVIDAFQDYIFGSISRDLNELQSLDTADGNVVLTALAAAPQLSYLYSMMGGFPSNDGVNITIAERLEEMFRNATLSLMSQDDLIM
jgi:hypothetical protein